MFICPVCYKKFDTEPKIQSHFLRCWKEEHPYHKGSSLEPSASIETREINDDIMNFFNSFKENK